MLILFGILIIVSSIILGFIVLIQNPKGGGISGSLGGFSNQLMGVKQSTDVMEKGTWIFYLDRAGARGHRDAVPHGVFRKRLQDQDRHRGALRARVQVDLKAHAVGKAHVLDLQVALEHFDLLKQRHPLTPGVVERIAQQLRQSGDHGHRLLLAIGAHQAGNGI